MRLGSCCRAGGTFVPPPPQTLGFRHSLSRKAGKAPQGLGSISHADPYSTQYDLVGVCSTLLFMALSRFAPSRDNKILSASRTKPDLDWFTGTIAISGCLDMGTVFQFARTFHGVCGTACSSTSETEMKRMHMKCGLAVWDLGLSERTWLIEATNH